ncbi:MAG TPA: squalene/phytoene synthase family protein [Kofleriaceae bacterium]|nr:squalene/phytoene synthase family protein [Kofleriaceae bacterium]
MFLGAARRNAFRDVYRFVRAADDVADRPGASRAERRAELAGWRTELDALYEGHPGHPHAQRLADVVGRYRLERRCFDTLLDGLEADIDRTSVASWQELCDYCEQVAASLAYLSLQILGADTPRARRYARNVAIAIQLANIVRDLREDAERGVVYLPADALAAEGLDASVLLDGHWSPGLARVCAELADRARSLAAAGRRELAGADPSLRRRLLVPEIWTDVYLQLLDELEAAEFDVFSHRPYLRRRRKLAIALRRVFGTNWYPFQKASDPC